MASVNKPLDDEDLINQTTTAQSGIVGNGAAAQDPNTSQAQGSSWTNLQDYLSANKGQGEAIADTTLKNTNDEIAASKKATEDWSTDAKARADANTKQDKYGAQIKNGSAEDVAKLAGDKDYSAWKSLSNYWGATSAGEDSGYADTYNKAQKANDKVNQANTWEGQQVMAKDTFGKNGTYTDGMGLLDTFVARQDAPNKFASFQADNKDFAKGIENVQKGFDTYVQGTKGVDGKYTGGAYDRGAANYASTMNAIKGKQSDFDKAATDRAGADMDRQFLAAQSQIEAQYKAAGLEAPKSVLGYVNPDSTYNNKRYTDPEIAALNALADMDDDMATTNNYKNVGGNNAYTVDQTMVNEGIGAGQEERALARAQAALAQQQADAKAKAIEEARKKELEELQSGRIIR